MRILPITNLKRELSNYLTNEEIDLLTKLYNIIKIGFFVFLSQLPAPPLFDSLLWSHDGDQPTPRVTLLKLKIQQERDRTLFYHWQW